MRGRRWIWTIALSILVVISALLPHPAPSDGAPARGAYDWPLVPRPPVVRGFDPPSQRWESGHRGVDLGTSSQSAVLAAGSGTVQFAGVVAGRPVVSVLHPDGVTTTYEPVTPRVRSGDRVERGTVLGYLESAHPGCTVSACLHWGARRGTGRAAVYLNPLSLVGALRIRLKPLRPGDAPDRGPPAAVRR